MTPAKLSAQEKIAWNELIYIRSTEQLSSGQPKQRKPYVQRPRRELPSGDEQAFNEARGTLFIWTTVNFSFLFFLMKRFLHYSLQFWKNDEKNFLNDSWYKENASNAGSKELVTYRG